MDNFRFLKNINWINQYLFSNQKLRLADFMGWSADLVSALESGAAPTLDQLSKLQNQLGISFQELIECDLSAKNDMRWIQFFTQKEDQDCNEYDFIEIPLNIRKAGASNFSAVKPPKKTVRHLAKICIPLHLFEHQEPSNLRAFEIEGFSMHPLVRSGDVIIAERLQNFSDYKEGEPHILLLKDESLFFKRLFKVRNEPKKVQLLSDNPDFPQITLGTNLIAECWKMCHHIKSTEF